MNVNALGSAGASTVTIAEAGYIGAFTESDTCAGISTLTTASAIGPSSTFIISGVATGTCAATFADANRQTVVVAVVVTTTGVRITSVR